MLNIFNSKLNKDLKKSVDQKKVANILNHYPPASKEWNNIIYAYNKNSVNLTPTTNKVVDKLLRGYFNLYSRRLEFKIKQKKKVLFKNRFKKIRRLSSHRIYMGKSEFKHTNNKVIINIFIYNRQKYNLLSKMKKKYLMFLNIKIKSKFIRKILFLKKRANILFKKVNQQKKILINTIKWKDNFKYYENLYYKKYIKKSLIKEMKYLYLKRMLLFNQFKFKYTYLERLTNLIKKIYNKNVEFNIVNLKSYYLNSDILSESLLIKLRKKRKNLLKTLKLSLKNVTIPKRSLTELKGFGPKMNKLLLKKSKPLINLSDMYVDTVIPKNYLENTVLNSIKYKAISGVRLETAGRLSKKFAASKSIYKAKYKGNLRNTDSSYKGLSSVVLRGYAKSNIQFTKVKSKTRIGSYGIKGWVSSS